MFSSELVTKWRRSLPLPACIGALAVTLALAPSAGANPWDRSFGRNGVTFVGLQGDVRDVVVQPDKRILVSGVASADGDSCFVARLLPNGGLDRSFATGGIFRGQVATCILHIALEPTGEIVGSGRGNLVRLTARGRLDRSFGDNGLVLLPDAVADPEALVALPDGDIALASESKDASGNYPNYSVARFDADGTPDQAFGDGGLATHVVGTDVAASALTLTPQGQLVVAGTDIEQGGLSGVWTSDFLLASFGGSGELDSSFGDAGTVRTSFGSGADGDGVNDAALDHGKLVVAGYSAPSPRRSGFALARYRLPTGQLDRTFSGDGKATTSFGPLGGNHQDEGAGTALAVTVDGENRIVAGGWGGDGWTLARYLNDGHLDRSFGKRGILNSPRLKGHVEALARQGGSDLIAAGFVVGASGTRIAVARYR